MCLVGQEYVQDAFEARIYDVQRFHLWHFFLMFYCIFEDKNWPFGMFSTCNSINVSNTKRKRRFGKELLAVMYDNLALWPHVADSSRSLSLWML